MTRVNVGIDPRELPGQLLIAELSEMIRIPSAIAAGTAVLRGPDVPTFRLNTGHVRFFYRRLGYLRRRYRALRSEGLSRNYNLSDFEFIFDECPPALNGEYQPTDQDREILLERFKEKGHTLQPVESRDHTL